MKGVSKYISIFAFLLNSISIAIADNLAAPADIKECFTDLVPDGGEIWYVGESKNITWKTLGDIGLVDVHYSLDGGNTYTKVIAIKASNVNGYFWPVPDVIGDQVRVRVQSSRYPDEIYITSASNFKIRARLQVFSPNGDEVWIVGNTTKKIAWGCTGTINLAKIEYSTNNGVAYNLITSEACGGPGGIYYYNWSEVPDVNSEQCLVKVSAPGYPSLNDVSDTVFSIRPRISVSEPAAGTCLRAGSANNLVKWSIIGASISMIKLEYSIDGGTYTTIATNIDVRQGKKGYSWNNIPDNISQNVVIKISDVDNPNVYNISPVFHIVKGPEPAIVEGIAAVVNDEVILLSEVESALSQLRRGYQAAYQGKELADRLAQAKEEILDKLIEKRILLQEARARGIEPNSQDILTMIKKIKKTFPSEDKFMQALQEQNLTLDQFSKHIEEQLRVKRLVEQEVELKINVGTEEIQSYYEANKNDFSNSPQCRIKHILIKDSPGGDAEKRVQEALIRIKEGEDFSAVAKNYSEDPSASSGGDIGFLEKDGLIPEIRKTIEALKVGEVSEVIKTKLGYQIIKIEAIKEARVKDFDEVKEEIRRKIFQEKFTKNYQEWLAGLKKDSYTDVKKDLYPKRSDESS